LEIRALLVTSAVAAATLATLVTIGRTGAALGVAEALFVFAASQAVGVLVGLLLAGLPLLTVSASAVVADFSEAWRHGRWAIGGVAVTWIQSQAYAYVTVAASAGAAGVGRANAARLLVSPFLVLVPAINQVAMPRFAAMRAADPRRMVATGRTITAGLLVLAVLYSAVLLLAADWIVPALLGPTYVNMRPLVAAWCAVLAAMLLRDTASTLLQAMKRFRELMLLNALSAAVSLAAVAVFMAALGEAGAVVGTVAGELVLAALLWRKIRNEGPTVG
jgi:O-antigen/teichoic acid export membrane protein